MVHAQLMRPISRSRNVVRILAATLVPEHCSSGHCGKLCRSPAQGQRNCWPIPEVCRATQSVKYQPSSPAPPIAPDRSCSVSVDVRNGLMHRDNQQLHSITSSARASSVDGTLRPSTFAVLRLITSSYLVEELLPTSEKGVRRGKAALSSGCEAHPATAPAGSNRSSHGGDEVAEASGLACHDIR